MHYIVTVNYRAEEEYVVEANSKEEAEAEAYKRLGGDRDILATTVTPFPTSAFTGRSPFTGQSPSFSKLAISEN
jgi:hypothetical protein